MSAPRALPDAERDAAFEREALACLPDVARFARSLTRDQTQAEDLVQETFLRAYAGYHTFQPGSSIRRWLFSICHHAFLRLAQREQRLVLTEKGEDAELEVLAAVHDHAAAHRAGVDHFIRNIDIGPAIRAAIDSLLPVYRCTVLLVDVDGMTYEEAAEVLGVPTGTVRSRLFRARRLLQQQLLAHARDAGVAGAPSSPSAQTQP